MNEYSLSQLAQRLDKMSGLRVLVVGDVLLDEYRVGDVERVSPEAPVPIVRVREERFELGGAGNVARSIVSLGAACDLVGIVGADAEGAAVRARAADVGVNATGLVEATDRPTSLKVRIVARGQQMLRIDREEDRALSSEVAETLRAAVLARLEDCDAVVLADYDKGVFAEGDGPALGRWVIEAARSRGCFVAVDPKRELSRFRGASLIKPNLEEALGFLPGSAADFVSRQGLLEKIQRALAGGEVVVTRGADGMSALDAEGAAFDVPTRALEVFDVQGAGDTSIAALTLCRAAGATLLEACIVANAAAAVAVEKVGTAGVTRKELLERFRDSPFLTPGSDEERM